MTLEADVVAIGGGPAGSAAARVLADCGHRVLVLTRTSDPSRGLAESLPPSTRKVLAEIGVLDKVDGAGFLRTTGNTVWWGSRDGEAENFDAAGDVRGWQVFRPDLDRLLLASARSAGVRVISNAHVQRVHMDGTGQARVDYRRDGLPPASIACRFALDCSGRAGVIARQGLRRLQSGYRTQAFIGVWRRTPRWALPDPTHTLVETYEDGWAYSIPVSETTRHVGLVVDGATTRISRGPTLAATYCAEIGKTRRLGALMEGAILDRVWACDASLYWSDRCAGPEFLLVGDAASFIDPLSSFGVKKALASAWVGAIAVHTSLIDPGRRQPALDFFSRWEQRVYASSLTRSRDYAREAYERHPHPFWALRADASAEPVEGEIDERALIQSSDVQAAFEALKARPSIDFTCSDEIRLASRAIIRDREIVLDEAVPLPGLTEGARFLAGVDLVSVRELACRHRQVPDLVDEYWSRHGSVPLPNLLAALSVLVAKGVVVARSA